MPRDRPKSRPTRARPGKARGKAFLGPRFPATDRKPAVRRHSLATADRERPACAGQWHIAPAGNRSRGYLIAKRIIDVAGAIVILVLVSPVLLTVLAILTGDDQRASVLLPGAAGISRPPVSPLQVSHHGPRRGEAAVAGQERAGRAGLQEPHRPADHAHRQVPAQDEHRRVAAVVQRHPRRHVADRSAPAVGPARSTSTSPCSESGWPCVPA